ncbi:MAG: BRCT domain-containing protein, partial [bacterium]
AGLEELTLVMEIGPVVGESVFKFFREPANCRMLRDLASRGVACEELGRQHRGPLHGKVFLFTGGLTGLGREEAKRRVEALGGRAASGVSKKVDYLVAGEDPGSKLEDARRLGITILSEAEFREMISP